MLNSISYIELFVFSFAVFRLTRLLVYDQITSFIRKPFLEEVVETNDENVTETYVVIKGKGIRAFLGELLSCYWCTGIWCAAGLFLGGWLFPAVFEPVIMILAIAGMAGVIEAIVEKLVE
ncbi:Sporulation protein YjcA [Anoxybacillus sp. P3H1B]|uniref:DUF1360 domain-containing protein n=1 Tax=Anoxybacillaceae TaxID=3120669 RepID=UPI0007962903|nr:MULTISPECIES: DUF1360 domain-containing protein [Anoxybacillus]KXG09584.1 Sporulation protein YjcA [Anoxybacillus sp. P3H1B]QHC05269.1 DUF1360 domain-containing protein [Anoxybacillus sp. PDR2]